MDDFEKRWKRIQDQLLAQASGNEPRPVSSGRTLFGIRSEAEQKMDRFAREIEDDYRAKRLAERETEKTRRAEHPAEQGNSVARSLRESTSLPGRPT